MGRGLEDGNRTGANAGAGVVCGLGWGGLGLGPAVGGFDGTSLAAFPGLRGTGFRGPLLGLAFLVASDPVDFLLPVGAEPRARVAGGRVVLMEPGLGAGDGCKTVGWGGLRVPVWAGPGSLALLLFLVSVWTTEGTSFLEEPVAGGGGRPLGGGGLGVPGFLWMGFTVGRETLAGAGWGVGSAGFFVGRADFVKEGGAAFWGDPGLWTGATEEGAVGSVGGLLGILVAVLFCNVWTDLELLAGEAGDVRGSNSLADSLAGGSGVQAGLPTVTRCWGSMVLVLWGLEGVGGTTVTQGPLPAGRDPRAGAAVVRFSRPSRARSVWKAKGEPASWGRRGPSRGRYMSACPHCFLKWAQ